MKTSNTQKLILVIGIAVLAVGYGLFRPKSTVSSPVDSANAEKFDSSDASSATLVASIPKSISGPVGQQSPSGTQRGITGTTDSLNQFLSKFDKKAEWRISRADDGRTIAISGGMISGIENSASAELAFAQQIAELTGVPGEQIVSSENKLEDTPYTEAKQYDQEVGGYLVFGGYMKIFRKKPDGGIYYVANETRNVGDVDLRIKYSFAEAKAVALRQYSGKTGVIVENNPAKPVIYSERAGHGELAWEVLVRIQGPLYDYRHLMVSAISGAILKDITLIKN